MKCHNRQQKMGHRNPKVHWNKYNPITATDLMLTEAVDDF